MRFEFATATQIVFGPGTLREAGKLAKPWGRRALVVTGGTPSRSVTLLQLLEAEGITTATFPVAQEPTVKTVVDGLAAARSCGAEMVIGFGGGSVIDAAKAIAGLYTNPGEPLEHLANPTDGYMMAVGSVL